MIENQLFELIEMAVGEQPVDPGTIAESLENRNSLVKLHALEVLRNHYTFDLTGKILKLVFDRDEKVRAKAAQIIQTDPLFAFEQREEFAGSESNTGGRGIYLEALFSANRKREFSNVLEEIADADFHHAVEDFAMLPGVENLELDRIFSGSREKFLEPFDRYRRDYFLEKYSPQIAVAPSYKCSLGCSYCFANDLITVFPQDMTLEGFQQLLDTVNPENSIKRVGFLGGEPAIFPGLNQFALELKKRNLDFYVATNGVVEPGIFKEILEHPNLINVTVHIEKDDFYSRDQRKKLLINVWKLGKENIPTIIRYNLLEPGHRDWDFLLNYMDVLPRFTFSFAVVFPSQSANVNYIRLEKLKDFSGKIISLLTFLEEEKPEGNIKIVFAKPYPPCVFTDEEFKFVLKHAEYKNVCEIDKNHYTNNTCINPDLSYFPCMALTRGKYRGEKALPFEDLKRENKSTAGFLVKKPVMKECENCRLFLLGVCQAACYAYVE